MRAWSFLKMAFLDQVRDITTKIEGFTSSIHEANGEPCLVLSHTKLFDHAPLGNTSRVKITIGTNREFIVHVLLEEVEKGLLERVSDVASLCERYSTESTVYKFCPGYDPTEYKETYHDKLHYDVKGIRRINTPVHRIQSVRCLRWHKLGKTASKERKQASEVLCRSCIIQRSHLDRQVQRKLAESPTHKLKRQCASSRAKLTYMSPISQHKRKESQFNRTRSFKAKLNKYELTELALDDQQDKEMENVMEAIERESSDKLEELFREGEKHGVGQILREIWNTDKKQKESSFYNDQASNSML